jgi:hypothetical protein
VDYLQWLFQDVHWQWVDDASKIALLKPDVVVFMSNESSFDGVLDDWTPKVFVHLSDEWGRTPFIYRLTEKIPLVLRQYRFPHYYEPKNVRHIPLGFMACMFDNPFAIAAPASIAERPFEWSFIGSAKGERMNALATFDSWGRTGRRIVSPVKWPAFTASPHLYCARAATSQWTVSAITRRRSVARFRS